MVQTKQGSGRSLLTKDLLPATINTHNLKTNLKTTVHRFFVVVPDDCIATYVFEASQRRNDKQKKFSFIYVKHVVSWLNIISKMFCFYNYYKSI